MAFSAIQAGSKASAEEVTCPRPIFYKSRVIYLSHWTAIISPLVLHLSGRSYQRILLVLQTFRGLLLLQVPSGLLCVVRQLNRSCHFVIP